MITALVIVTIILLNVLFTSLSGHFLWQIDMTQEKIFTLSANCKQLLDDTFEDVEQYRQEQGMTEPLKVTFKFCDLEDNIMSNLEQRYILMTAKELANRYSEYIDIEFINTWDNPTAVDRYKTSVHTVINKSDIIIASGTEHRIFNVNNFFERSKDGTPWAYLGEKRFASAILAVTQTESPIAGILMGHGETFTDTALVDLLQTAGYEPMIIDDLVTQDIPEDCRLLVCYNPTEDFLAADSVASDISEIRKLDEFLAGENHSLMVFMSPSAPALPNFEEYLELWGISFTRYTDPTSGETAPCIVKDSQNALTGDGLTIVGQYETAGSGAKFTEDMRNVKNPRRVIFKNTMPISLSDQFEIYYGEDDGQAFSYGYKSLGNGNSRTVFNIFSAAKSATLIANGEQVEKTAKYPYGLMTVSIQSRQTQEESNLDYFKDNPDAAFSDQNSYVLACGSVDAMKQAILQSVTYGNQEVLLKAMGEMGKKPVPLSLPFNVFQKTTIESLTTTRANAYTVSLVLIPAAIIFGVGTFVIIWRKHA